MVWGSACARRPVSETRPGVDLVADDQHVLAVGAHLAADLIVGERLLEQVERRHEDRLLRRTRLRLREAAERAAVARPRRAGVQPHLVVEEGEDVVVDFVLVAEVEVEAVAEHLRLRVGEQVLGHQHDQRVLLGAAAREVAVRLLIVREEGLAEQRQDHLSREEERGEWCGAVRPGLAEQRQYHLRLAGSDLREVEALLSGDDLAEEGLLRCGGHDLVAAVDRALVLCKVVGERVDERREIHRLGGVEVEELRTEEGVVGRVRRLVERVPAVGGAG